MTFLDKLKRLFAGSAGPQPASKGEATTRSSGKGPSDPYGLLFYFRCDRCGSVVRVRADKRNDLMRDEEGPGALLWRKDVMDNKCFRMMQVEIWMDENHNIVTATVDGGTMITAEEYETAKQGF